MNVLSLFDGIACARVALERAGIKVDAYYASEVDEYAIAIAQRNWPDILQLGDIKTVGYDAGQFCRKANGEYNTLGVDFIADIDLMIGGSPCQDLSIAKSKRDGLKGARSGLFYEYLRLLKEVKPKWFVLENVASMPKGARDEITKQLGVEPMMIDASLVSAQRRKRLFWTNIPNIAQPDDRGIYLKDILEDLPIPPQGAEIREKSKTLRVGGRGSADGDKHEWDSVYQYRRSYWRETKGGKVPTLTANMGTGGNNVPYVAALTERRTEKAKKIRREFQKKHGRDFSPRREKILVPRGDGKANTITTGVTKESLVYIRQTPHGKNAGGNVSKNGKTPTLTTSDWQSNNKLVNGGVIRKLTPIECERLQSLPDKYTEGVSNTRRYHALGNAFNADVVAHIFRSIP